jgi:hypothetical protein
MNINHLFNSTVSTYKFTETVDAGGSPIQTWGAYLTDVKCRIQKNRGLEPVMGGRMFSQSSYVLYCNSDTDIELKHIVLYESEYFNVVDIKIEGNSDLYLKVTLEKTDDLGV